MTPVVVLDASALLAAVLRERGGDVVKNIIQKPNMDVLMHAVNAFEVITKLRYRGLSGDNAWSILALAGVTRVDEIGDEILAIAVNIKYSAPELSLGDCFCIALAEHVGGECLTSDKAFQNADTPARITLFRESLPQQKR